MADGRKGRLSSHAKWSRVVPQTRRAEDGRSCGGCVTPGLRLSRKLQFDIVGHISTFRGSEFVLCCRPEIARLCFAADGKIPTISVSKEGGHAFKHTWCRVELRGDARCSSDSLQRHDGADARSGSGLVLEAPSRLRLVPSE